MGMSNYYRQRFGVPKEPVTVTTPAPVKEPVKVESAPKPPFGGNIYDDVVRAPRRSATALRGGRK